MAENIGRVYFAETDFRGRHTRFAIKNDDRSRHVYVIGKTGMGKSTLLENVAIQDIQNGEGICFIDPHGKTAELLLDYVPESRLNDVIYFAPFDLDYPVAFNVMEDIGKDQRHLVANGLMATFKKIWPDVWSGRMEYILSNTILALLEYPGSTLLGVNRMLSDKNYRKKIVDNISDPSVKSFWVDEFAKYNERYMQEATDAIKNKIGQFTANPLIRNIIGQPKSSFNLRAVMDERKILIINLSKGRVGEVNTELLGSMLITKIYLAAMSRANLPDSEVRRLPPNFLFVDEFQSFVNDSFANIMSEARKYKLSLTIAHQYIEQMPETVSSAVFGNVGTIIAFRVGPLDAELLEKIFAPTFTIQDLVSLGFAQVYLTLMIDGVGSPPFSAVTLPPIPPPEISYRERIIENIRQRYARLREKVEEEIVDWYGKEKSPPDENPAQPKRPERVYQWPPADHLKTVEKNQSPGPEREEPKKFASHPTQKTPLSSLKPQSLKDKGSGKNLNELRQALAEVGVNSLSPTAPRLNNLPAGQGLAKNEKSFPTKSRHGNDALTPGEVPENELRELINDSSAENPSLS